MNLLPRLAAPLRRWALGALSALALTWACGPAEPDAPPPPTPGDAPAPGAAPWFEDVTATTGITFRHHNGAGGDKHLLEMNGGGVALLDQDGDGDLDALFPQSIPLPGRERGEEDWRDRFFRQQEPFVFEDDTEAMDCDDGAFTLSATVPDFDGDGDPDVCYANFGANRLLRNDGVRFVDVTDGSGFAGERWSSASTWADLDRDGDLDCYVANYLTYSLQDFEKCGKLDRGPEWHAYCNPLEYPGQLDRLYENLGQGRFRDVTEEAGLGGADGKALGLTTLDVDGDGLLDVFVANDTTPNYLWHNQGGLRFVDVASARGVDLASNGLAEACMGVDLADVDGDQDFDLVVTNFSMETNTLYRNEGDWYTDRSFPSGLGDPSLPYVAFGARFGDYDNDGDEDLVTANGHILDNVHLYQATLTFAQPPQLYRNDGSGRFALVPVAEAGPYFGTRQVGRGIASFDPDDDGALDLIYVHNNGAPVVLRNRRGGGHWIGVALQGPPGNPTAIGAQVTVEAGGRRWVRARRGANSYISVSDPRLHVGLGAVDRVERVRVTWPDGTESVLDAPAADRYHAVSYGD